MKMILIIINVTIRGGRMGKGSEYNQGETVKKVNL